MGFKKIIIRNIEYQLRALVPTAIGFSIILVGFYLLIVDALLDINAAMKERSVEWIVNNQSQIANIMENQVSPFIGVILMLVGYAIHRIGRSYIYAKFQAEDTEDKNEPEPDLLTEEESYE